MRASSEAAFRAAQQRWEPVLREAGGAAGRYGEQLFAVTDLIHGSGPLRRTLTDPAVTAEHKAGVVGRLLTGQVDAEVVDLVSGLVRERWSAEEDLEEVTERLAVDSYLAAAQAEGRLRQVEEELFQLDRLLVTQRDLRLAIVREDFPAERRGELVDAVLAGRVSAETQALVRRVVAGRRHRSIRTALQDVGHVAAARRGRLVATVTAAVPLTREQVTRLEAALSRLYDTPVEVTVGVDPALVGGLRVQVGEEVIDGTVLARLQDARRRLAG